MMTTSAWIALASLAFAVFAQGSILSFLLGGVFSRVRHLEAANEKRVDMKPEMAALTATVQALTDRMTEMKTDTHAAFADLNHIMRNRLMANPLPRS